MRTRIWFDPPLFRWSRVLGLAVVGIAVTVGWIAYERGVWQPLEMARPAVALAPAASAPGRTPPAAARTVSPRTGSAGVAEMVGLAEAPAADGAVEVCGVGRVSPGPVEETLRAAFDRLRGPAQEAAWLKAMRGSGDARQRAAGLLLSEPAGGFAGERDELARLAYAARDPAVYGWALHACRMGGGKDPSSPCGMLSVDTWAALDPDNAVAWYAIAEESMNRGNDPREALFHAARAKRYDSRYMLLPAVALTAAPAGTAPMVRQAMLVRAMGTAAALTPLAAPSRFCTREALREPNRRALCETLTDNLAAQAGTLIELEVARGVGERLGWSAQRLKALRDEIDGLTQIVMERSGGDKGVALACDEIDTLERHYTEAGRLGELDALRAELRRSGRDVTQVAAKARSARAVAAQRAASEASSPSQ
jgi:hypothetical protein